MREIKFRAWDSGKRKFIYTSVPRFNGCWDIDFLDVEFQMATGLKDKNGKEIYEGDIVNTDGIVKEVVFDKWLPGFIGLVSYPGEIEVDEKKIEVIGNIYENPELLK